MRNEVKRKCAPVLLSLLFFSIATSANAGMWLGQYIDNNGRPGTHIEMSGRATENLHLYAFADVFERYGGSAFARANATYDVAYGLGAFAQVDAYSGGDAELLGVAYRIPTQNAFVSLRALGVANGPGELRVMIAWDIPLVWRLSTDGFADVDNEGTLHEETQLRVKIWGALSLIAEQRHHAGHDSVALGVRCDLY